MNYKSLVVKQLDQFKPECKLTIAKEQSHVLRDVADKVYTRDLSGSDEWIVM